MTAERPVGSGRIYEGRVISRRTYDVELPSAQRAAREIVEHRGAVAIVPLINGDVVLVRQFRAAVGRALLGLHAGSLEPGESVEGCLQRELAEEIAMRAGRTEHLITFYPSPGFLTEAVHVYAAGDLVPHRLYAEEEDLSVERVPLAKAVALVGQGEIVDAKSIIGLLLLDARRDPPR